MIRTSSFNRWGSLLFGILLVAWVAWLRAPSWHVMLWNVDESIHAAVANTLLDGGLMYRDAVDQRTPLSYYAFAGIFRVAGANNLPAVRVTIAAMIAGTAFGLFLLGKRTRRPVNGIWAALIFVAWSTRLLIQSDAFAAHTEWFVALFTTYAALVFLGTNRVPSFNRSLAAGALWGLAFLSKQPALTDFFAPLFTLLYLVITRVSDLRGALRSLGGLLAGFGAVVGAVACSFYAIGAAADGWFFTWIYNVKYYGPELGWGDRLLSPAGFFTELITLYPLVFLGGIVGAGAVSLRLAQLCPTDEMRASRRWESFLLLWCGSSLAGAMASGRGFDHYFIQCLPPFAWMAAWVPSWLMRQFGVSPAPKLRGLASLAAAIGLGALAINVIGSPLKARQPTYPPADPALPLSAFIVEHTRPTDKIFVWGYNPDIYMYTNRLPASRFVYCTFQTGLIPWTNEKPSIDTTYAIVPGSMKVLLDDLRRHRPAFIIDCGVGPHRRFSKYPLSHFAPLAQYVEENYVEIEPARYGPQGFRLFMRRAARGEDLSSREVNESTNSEAPTVRGPSAVGSGISIYRCRADAGQANLTRLALYAQGREIASVESPPAGPIDFQVPVMFPSDQPAKTILRAAATFSDGTRLVSTPYEVVQQRLESSPEQRVAFSLPILSGRLPADGVRALFNPRADGDDGHRQFNLHAPSLVTYTLPKEAKFLRGSFGISPGAYAPENKAPTDGAAFIVRVIGPDQTARILFERLLDPAKQAGDRPVQNFQVSLAHLAPASRVELEINPGPNGVPSSDWAFWSDVVLETAP
jgi:hypothetical protein